MKKYIIIASILFTTGMPMASSVFPINNKIFEQAETNNTVFNIVYKEFIKNYEEDFLKVKSSIVSNNEKRDKSINFIYVELDKRMSTFYFNGNGDLDTALNRLLSDHSYDLKRIAKLKYDYQEREVDSFLNDQLKNYRNILKNTLYDYDINNEEKKFIADKSKKIAEIIKSELDSNNGYSKKKLDELTKKLYTYKHTREDYITDLKDMNDNIDSAMFREIWPSMLSNSKYPDQD